MEFITCASYYGTGSSAITDYVSEFDDIFSMTDFEFRFLQDPDGIDDLYYHLVENHNRHNAGHAIKRYLKLANFLNGSLFRKHQYAYYFQNKWLQLTNNYIEKLTDFSYKGWWMYDLYDRGSSYYLRKRLINKILTSTVWRGRERQYNSLKDELTLCSHPTSEEFIDITKSYIGDLFRETVPKGFERVVVDQIVPPSNIARYTRYFDNIKVIVVERDPRDVFALNKLYWHGGIVPEDPKLFVQWYRYTRNHRKVEKYDTDTVMLLQFEDFVFDYDNVCLKLNNFLSLDEELHSKKGRYFNPSISCKNTQCWRNSVDLEDDINIIEHFLPEYLYNFDRA